MGHLLRLEELEFSQRSVYVFFMMCGEGDKNKSKGEEAEGGFFRQKKQHVKVTKACEYTVNILVRLCGIVKH